MAEMTEHQELLMEQFRSISGGDKAYFKRLCKASNITLEVEPFERFDFEVESGTNKGKVFPMLMVNSSDGKKHKAIPLWVAEAIKDDVDSFILTLETILEEVKSQ
jgi:hypothetical protein